MKVTQLYTLINNVTKEILGDTAVVNEDLSNVVDIGKSILLFNGQIQDISDEFGFHSWINDRSKEVGVWNPSTFNHVVGYYDKVNGDVLFISKDECLAFSEPLKAFTSFYSYNNVPYFITIKDKGIWVN